MDVYSPRPLMGSFLQRRAPRHFISILISSALAYSDSEMELTRTCCFEFDTFSIHFINTRDCSPRKYVGRIIFTFPQTGASGGDDVLTAAVDCH